MMFLVRVLGLVRASVVAKGSTPSTSKCGSCLVPDISDAAAAFFKFSPVVSELILASLSFLQLLSEQWDKVFKEQALV